jgi:hypothetical protein
LVRAAVGFLWLIFTAPSSKASTVVIINGPRYSFRHVPDSLRRWLMLRASSMQCGTVSAGASVVTGDREGVSDSSDMAAAAPRVIWHSDFLIETSVFGDAAKSRYLYERLALQLHRMTRSQKYGKAWIPWTAFGVTCSAYWSI